MNKQITVTVNGKPRRAVTDLTLSEIVGGEKPCGGHGRCGKCKVIAVGELSPITEAELRLLTEAELASGVRLACMTYPLGDCYVKTVSATAAQVLTVGDVPEIELNPTYSAYGVAIDIGTTTVAARLYGKGGALLAEASRLNPQSAWGSDVVSRIEAAIGGKAHALALAIREVIDVIIAELAKHVKIDTDSIDGICITGNTVMLALLTESSAEPFSHAPFDVKRLYGESLRADEIGLSAVRGDTLVYLPPCVSAFVGADITCAILASGLCDGESAVLADIGTNGEMALWHGGRLKVCSTAAGPAFEGVGIRFGCRGGEGAIDKVKLEGESLVAHVIGGGEPIGICGSGLIDSVACMLEAGIIDESGYLDDEYTILPPVTLIPQDIRMVQLAKSAVCAGLLTLADSEGVSVSDISTLYIAGGFGNYLNVANAVKIGLLPSRLADRVKNVGNAALVGASMLLLNKAMRQSAHSLASAAETVSLAANPAFSERYMNGMFFEKI